MHLFLSAIQNPQSEIAGSSTWQTVFLSFAVVLILFEMIRGWRLGVMRQLMRVAAVAAAYPAAYFGAEMLVPILRSSLKMPDIVISTVAGVILAAVVYGIISSLGTILFKRTAQQSSGIARLVYGSGGALLGICFGAFFIWLLLVGIRLAGSIADAQVQAQAKNGNLRAPAAQSRSSHDASLSPSFDADSLMRLLAPEEFRRARPGRWRPKKNGRDASGSASNPWRDRPGSGKPGNGRRARIERTPANRGPAERSGNCRDDRTTALLRVAARSADCGRDERPDAGRAVEKS